MASSKKSYYCWDCFCAVFKGEVASSDTALPFCQDDLDVFLNAKPDCYPVEFRVSDGTAVEYVTFTGVVDGVPQFDRGSPAQSWPAGSTLCFTWTETNVRSIVSHPDLGDDIVWAVCVQMAEYDNKGLDITKCSVQDVVEQIICQLALINDSIPTSEEIKTIVTGCITAGLLADGDIKTVIEACIDTSIEAGLEPDGVIKSVIQACIDDIDFPVGLTKAEVNTCIDAAIDALDYYTRSEVNSIAENLQNQINNLTTCVNANKVCIAELKAVDPITPPTLDVEFDDLTDPICPQCVTRTVTNPDGVQFTLIPTGNGTVTVSVGGSAIADPSIPFDIADGEVIEVCVTGGSGVNVVGGVALNWIDPDTSAASPVDGFTYDVNCPADPPVLPVCPDDVAIDCADLPYTLTGFANITSFSVPSPWTATPGVGNTSVTIDSTTPADGILTVTASNADGSCTTDITVSGCTPTGISLTGSCGVIPGSDPMEPQTWCGVGQNLNAASGAICGKNITQLTVSDDTGELTLCLTGATGTGDFVDITITNSLAVSFGPFTSASASFSGGCYTWTSLGALLANDVQGSFTVTESC